MEFREIPQNPEEFGERADSVLKASHKIGPASDFIVRTLHETGMLHPGEKWTLTTGSSCGFRAEIEIRVFHLGSCDEQEGTPDQPISESSVIFATRKDGVKLPFPSGHLLKPHLLKSKPEKH